MCIFCWRINYWPMLLLLVVGEWFLFERHENSNRFSVLFIFYWIYWIKVKLFPSYRVWCIKNVKKNFKLRNSSFLFKILYLDVEIKICNISWDLWDHFLFTNWVFFLNFLRFLCVESTIQVSLFDFRSILREK